LGRISKAKSSYHWIKCHLLIFSMKMNKMKKNMCILSRISILAFASAFVVSSCSLDIDGTDSLITEESLGIFNGVADVDGSINNLYSSITGQSGDQANLYAMTEVTSDELLVPTRGTDWGDNGVWRTLHAHTWGATHEHILQVWNDKNSAVLRATEVIDPLSNATPAQVAHAKFIRAYNMWIVMDFYGQVPFRNPTDGVDIIPTVFSRSEAYELVVQDLTDAIGDLPASNPSASNKARAVKATAQFWLAKVKLNGHIYRGEDSPSSADMADVISLVNDIESSGYTLDADYFDIFPGFNQSNSEVIWTVDAASGNRMWNGLHYNQQHPDNTGGGWNGFTTLAEFYELFEGPTETNTLGSGQEIRRGYTQTLASTNDTNYGFGFGFQVGQMYWWDGAKAVALTDRIGNPLVFTKELPALVGNNERTGIRVLKYSPVNGGFTNGVVMGRYSDAHLMRAEAMFRSGTGDALAEINELRELRGASTLASLSLQDILDERGRELYTEGWRRNDLIRFGAFKNAWQFKAAGDGHTDLFPIPASAILSNPNLVQNPGY
jgi:starch-binding outer membrane protein, SusD/RagB family